MDAQNENAIIIGNAVEIVDIPEAQVLETDHTGDEGAEFLCSLYNVINYFESFLENPEEICLPDEDGEIPYITFIELLDELKDYRWARRTYNRMKERAMNVEPEERLTELQKSEHPEYKDWCCPKCIRYYKGHKQLTKHMSRNICQERNITLFVKAFHKKLPTPKFYHTALAIAGLIDRVAEYKKSIQPELEEEEHTP